MPDNDGNPNNDAAVSNDGTVEGNADNADTEVLGSAIPGSAVVAATAPPAAVYAASAPQAQPAAGAGALPDATPPDPAASGATTDGTVPPATQSSRKAQKRITIAALSLAGVIVLAGIFGSGVLLGTHLEGAAQPSQQQMQGGPGSEFSPGGEAPTQGGPGSGTRPGSGSGTDSGTDPGTDSGTADSGSTEGS
jgi:hypothetical protein